MEAPSGEEVPPPAGATASSMSERTGDSWRTRLCARNRLPWTSRIKSAAVTNAAGFCRPCGRARAWRPWCASERKCVRSSRIACTIQGAAEVSDVALARHIHGRRKLPSACLEHAWSTPAAQGPNSRPDGSAPIPSPAQAPPIAQPTAQPAAMAARAPRLAAAACLLLLAAAARAAPARRLLQARSSAPRRPKNVTCAPRCAPRPAAASGLHVIHRPDSPRTRRPASPARPSPASRSTPTSRATRT